MDKLPTDAIRAGSPGPTPTASAGSAAPAPRRRLLTQIVLPLAVFVVVIVSITIAANLVPGGKGPGPAEIKGDPLVFPLKVAIWDPRDTSYRAEYEKHTNGTYSFWFENRGSEAAELVFFKKSCACSEVDCCVLPEKEGRVLREAWRFEQQLRQGGPAPPSASRSEALPVLGVAASGPGPQGPAGILSLIDTGLRGNDGLGGLLGRSLEWQPLSDEKYRDRPVVVEPGAVGVIRLSWNTRNRENEQLDLTARLWMQAKGNSASRREVTLTVPVAMVPPLRIFPDKIAVTRWSEEGVGRGEFRCWSSTRVDLGLTAEALRADPCVEVKAIPLSGTECRQLEGDLRNQRQIATHVLSGYRVQVTLHQEKGKDRLELGSFQRWVSLAAKDIPGVSNVEVSGTVYSDVVVGQERDGGAIKLGSFDVSAGKYKEVFLWTKPDVTLVLPKEKDGKDISPAFMKVDLTRVEEGEAGSPAKWQLTIDIPAGAAAAAVGGWPRDGAITLQKVQQGKMRLIRIPVDANPFRRGS
jgi:hypothetical protein